MRHRDYERGEGGEGLTSEQFEALLDRLSPDREQAGALYEEIRCRLIKQFDRWQLDVDAEHLADKAMDRVSRRLAQGEVIHLGRPFGYFRGVAHRVALEISREAKRRDQALYAFAALYHPEPDPAVNPHLPCLQACLGLLSAEERLLIFRYFVFQAENRASERQRLAQELGIGLNALRIRAHRVRRKLGGCCSPWSGGRA